MPREKLNCPPAHHTAHRTATTLHFTSSNLPKTKNRLRPSIFLQSIIVVSFATDKQNTPAKSTHKLHSTYYLDTSFTCDYGTRCVSLYLCLTLCWPVYQSITSLCFANWPRVTEFWKLLCGNRRDRFGVPQSSCGALVFIRGQCSPVRSGTGFRTLGSCFSSGYCSGFRKRFG